MTDLEGDPGFEKIVASAQLTEISFESFGFTRPSENGRTPAPEEGELTVGLGVQQFAEPPMIVVRMTGETVSRDALLSVAVVGSYALSEDLDIREQLMSRFVEDVAATSLASFVREALVDLAARARVPSPILPLIGPGADTQLERVQKSNPA